ncbi:DUF305 domain-containing protein [Methylobacterium sp. NEAU 140]|uniref:CopM family metallochaperone n=1 Tax=Methylobacterium sp. NEAU 140 TaxID=3064945 RepID=UPI00273232F4|nr:DUF305 domain-containing protein [Methylobacterium sp. NEAU 140]MDP4022172.1 DUF305 domain-containing protein [Methylobacterium sp. NEAU 140]
MRRFVSLIGAALLLGSAGSAAPQAEPAHRHGHRAGHAGGHAHGGTARGSAADTPATRDYEAAHAQMMRGMAVPYTGDPDVDFRIQMIPHHQGAIDMAQVALRHAQDPWTRQLAESVIVEQQREIAEMRAWLARRGIDAPAGGQPSHVMGADSYRSRGSEAGTRSEAVGQSWAPGPGVR